MELFRTNKTLSRLDQMLTEAIEGTYEEQRYDESELSRLESRWKQYLSTSKLSVESARQDRENIKTILSDISHQTKTPLANIILYSELLKEQTLTPEGKELAEHLHGQAEKLEFLIQALVKMSRLEGNVLEVRPRLQPLAALLTKAGQGIATKAQSKSITINMESPKDAEAVFDLKWTEEALFNILDNAVKYSPAGSTVNVSVKPYNMYVCIRISDEGPGIPEQERNLIFRRFYRGEVNQQEEGVGIGLYLAREIIKKNEGYIKVNAGAEKGAAFKIYLRKGNTV